MHELKLPNWAREPVLRFYVAMLGIDMSEAWPRKLSAYETVGDLFARRLQPGVRVPEQGCSLVSPVDGIVLSAGPVGSSFLVKGIEYSLLALLGGGSAHEGRSLHQLTIYLSPGDYHGFHAPTDAVLSTSQHVAGQLLSVHPNLLARWPVLASNERVVLSGVWDGGFLALVAIGATGVGSIQLDRDPLVRTNAPGALPRTVSTRDLNAARVGRGERLGGFRLGSCVVLLFEAPDDAQPIYQVQPGQRVTVGEAIVLRVGPPQLGIASEPPPRQSRSS
mmetsp:Transcript_6204/g.16208  ORF Transcript_6204/g.16208 Transcript_6204/m.16208 type:complete len:277 (-) Transcript_6204:8-838(-)